jgi:hypothetical protein
MKRLSFFLFLFLIPVLTPAQRPQKMRNLWASPQVHVFFGEYKVSFAIRDINKALSLLRQNGDSTHVASCSLDTSINYTFELYPGDRTQYRNATEPLLQNVVGCYLLSAGMAEVEYKKNKRKTKHLEEVLVDIKSTSPDGDVMVVDFLDPETNKMLFSGQMPVILYKADIGIDDW